METASLHISEEEYEQIATDEPELALKLTQAVFRVRDRATPSATQSAASALKEEEDSTDDWEPMETLEDALRERATTPYLVEKLLPLPCVAMIYGIAGSLKSLLLMDLALCVAAGRRWLEEGGRGEEGQSEHVREGGGGGGFGVRKGNVLWVDLDQGEGLMAERLGALARARGVRAEEAMLLWKSFPPGGFSLLDTLQVSKMAKRLRRNKIQLLCIDNLGVAKGAADENTGDMILVLSNLRWIAEESGAAVVVLHHARKEHGFRSAGADLARGHSSISAGLDLALGVERDGQAVDILLRPTKCRRATIKPFYAQFSFEARPGSVDLLTARFWGQADLPGGQGAWRKPSHRQAEKRLPLLDEIDQAVVEALSKGQLGRGALVEAVRARYPLATVHKVRSRLDELVEEGRLRMKKGAKNTSWISLPPAAGEELFV